MQATSSGAPTIYDVAQEAGVSIATVSRVLNGRGSAKGSSDRVMAAVSALGFVPNGAARSLSQGLKQVVGIVYARNPATDELFDIEEESLLFTDSVVRGAEAGAEQVGYSLLLSGVGLGAGAPRRRLDALTGKVDGLILLDQVMPERQVAPLARKVPVVLLAGSGRLRSAVTVRVDNARAMTSVAEHLVAHHGCRRLAFVSGLEASPDSVMRAGAFADAVSAAGAVMEPLDAWAADWTSAGAVRATHRRLAGGEPLPHAVACANDQMAIGVMHALGQAGCRVPDDVAVVGFDDIPVARHLTPPLTTVRQPSRQLGATAVEVLVRLIEGHPPREREIVLPTELQIRGSCGCSWSGPDATDAWRIAV